MCVKQLEKTDNPVETVDQRFEETFHKEVIQVTNKPTKRGSTSLVVKEMQIKATISPLVWSLLLPFPADPGGPPILVGGVPIGSKNSQV